MPYPDGLTVAEVLDDTGRALMLLPSRTGLMVVDGQPYNEIDLARIALAVKFRRAIERDKSVMLRAVVEGWTLRDIVRFVH